MFKASCSSKAKETRLFSFVAYKQTTGLKRLVAEISLLSLHVPGNTGDFAWGHTNRKCVTEALVTYSPLSHHGGLV